MTVITNFPVVKVCWADSNEGQKPEEAQGWSEPPRALQTTGFSVLNEIGKVCSFVQLLLEINWKYVPVWSVLMQI